MHSILIATVALVGVPILLHLIMKQEPKRLPFPALRFLKAKQKTNQRKMRLRHWLLLALRMLVIALFGITLYQPTLLSSGVLSLAAEQPVAVAFVIDTSPSMGYRAGTVTRLAEARRRALELLDELPEGSKVAVIDPFDPAVAWEQTLADARSRIEAMKEPRGASVPVTAGIAAAYQLLRTVDQEVEAAEPLPRLVAVFSDRTTANWDPSRIEELQSLRDAVPAPAVAHVYFDVGIDRPTNVGIIAVEMKPQLVPFGQPVSLTVTLTSSGPEVANAVLRARIDQTVLPAKPVPVVGEGRTAAVTFELPATLPRGIHQLEFTLDTDDNLPSDNARYFTFKVAEPRKVLTIADNPEDAAFWSLAHKVKGEFDAEDVKIPAQVNDLAGYEAVCLLNVADPNQPLPGGGTLWEKLRSYVGRGGKLILLPGANAIVASYAADTNDLMPGSLKTVIETSLAFPESDARHFGVFWSLTDDADFKHPLLGEFLKWKRQGNVDFFKEPRRFWKYWEAAPAAGAGTIIAYDDDEDRGKRRPAVLEKSLGTSGGKVVLFTSRFDPQNERPSAWNDIWQNPNWGVAVEHQLLTYLAGNAADANFNFTAGEPIPVPLPKGDPAKTGKLTLIGPGVVGRDADLELGERQTELRLPAPRTTVPGQYLVSGESSRDGFSINVASTESDLTKREVADFTGLLGADAVVPIDKNVRFRDLLETKFNQPVELFPWLLLLVLFLFALEGVIANRFYRKV